MRPQLHRHQRVDASRVLPAKAFDFPLLRVGRDDQPNRLERLDQERADAGTRFSNGLHAPCEAGPYACQRPYAHRNQRDADEGEPWVEPEHRRDAAGKEQEVAAPCEQRLRGDTLDLADVVVDPREDVAERRPRVEPRRQPLQVAVQREPHVEQDLGRDARVAEAGERGQREARNRGQREQTDGAVERAEIAADERPVDQRLREIRQHERQPGTDDAQRCDERQPPPIWKDIRQRAAEFLRHQLVIVRRPSILATRSRRAPAPA